MKNIAPKVFRQRLLIELFYTIKVERKDVEPTTSDPKPKHKFMPTVRTPPKSAINNSSRDANR